MNKTGRHYALAKVAVVALVGIIGLVTVLWGNSGQTAVVVQAPRAVGQTPTGNAALITGAAVGNVCSSNQDCGLYEVCDGGSCADATDLVSPRESRVGALTVEVSSTEYAELLQSDAFVKVECPDGRTGAEMLMAHPFKDLCYVEVV